MTTETLLGGQGNSKQSKEYKQKAESRKRTSLTLQGEQKNKRKSYVCM